MACLLLQLLLLSKPSAVIIDSLAQNCRNHCLVQDNLFVTIECRSSFCIAHAIVAIKL